MRIHAVQQTHQEIKKHNKNNEVKKWHAACYKSFCNSRLTSENIMPKEEKKYVRVTGIKNDKYVEFDFAISNPEFYVELVLPFEMFDTFCKKNNVTFLENENAEEGNNEEVDRLMWRMSQARVQDKNTSH